MGKHHTEEAQAETAAKPTDPTGGWQNAQDHVPEQIPRQTPEEAAAANAQDFDSEATLAALKAFATPKIMVVGGRAGLLYITNYRPDFGYSGRFVNSESLNTGDHGVFKMLDRVSPYKEGDPYELQYIEIDDPDGPSKLRKMQRTSQARGGGAAAGDASSDGQSNG